MYRPGRRRRTVSRLLAGDEGRVSGVAHAQAKHVLPVEAPALSEDPLASRIVVFAVVEDPHAAVV
ncbi:MAG TPA: hypothetical protein VNC17_06140, partial [Thermoleophilaceae bacterium]|nr:hypothetical protein [Thermoleophilaceae bacterium]